MNCAEMEFEINSAEVAVLFQCGELRTFHRNALYLRFDYRYISIFHEITPWSNC